MGLWKPDHRDITFANIRSNSRNKTILVGFILSKMWWSIHNLDTSGVFRIIQLNSPYKHNRPQSEFFNGVIFGIVTLLILPGFFFFPLTFFVWCLVFYSIQTHRWFVWDKKICCTVSQKWTRRYCQILTVGQIPLPRLSTCSNAPEGHQNLSCCILDCIQSPEKFGRKGIVDR